MQRDKLMRRLRLVLGTLMLLLAWGGAATPAASPPVQAQASDAITLSPSPPSPGIELSVRYWRTDWKRGAVDATLHDDGTFADSEERTGNWRTFEDGQRLALAYPRGEACGALLAGWIAPNGTVRGILTCQDNFWVWGLFRGSVDGLPQGEYRIATVDAQPG